MAQMMTAATMEFTLPGTTFPAVGSAFPAPFVVIRVNPVLSYCTIREQMGDRRFERTVKLSVLEHALRVHGKLELAVR